MYIGTSLGGCLQSLMANEVSIDDVLLIVTRTRAPTFEKFIGVVASYITYGNPSSRNSNLYELSQNPAVKDLWDKVKMTVMLTDEKYR